MKKRIDFVTNSSSASYVLEITMENTDGDSACFELGVSDETCFSEDGDMTASYISLDPVQVGDSVCVSDKPLSSAKNIEELSDMLFKASMIEGWLDEDDFDDEDFDVEDLDDDDDDDYDYEGKITYVSEVAPKTINGFIERCKENNIEPENLKTITIRNMKFGRGESAMYIEDSDMQDAFDEYIEEKYGELEDEKEKINAFVEFIDSKPPVTVCDNEYCLPDKIGVAWSGTRESLQEMAETFVKNGDFGISYIIGVYAEIYRIDYKKNSVSREEVVLIGDI